MHKPRNEDDRVEVPNSGQKRQRENTPKAKEKVKGQKAERSHRPEGRKKPQVSRRKPQARRQIRREDQIGVPSRQNTRSQGDKKSKTDESDPRRVQPKKKNNRLNISQVQGH